MDAPMPVQQPSTEPPQKSSFRIILITIGIVLFVTAVGYLGYQNWQLRQEVNRLNTIIQVDSTPSNYSSPTPSPDPTADWRTYSNDVYRFSLKYPSEWKYLEVPNSIYETKNNEIWFTHGDFPPPNIGARADIVFIITSFDPSADWEPKYFDNYRSIVYQLDNITAKKITGINKEGLNQEFVIIARIGNYYLQVMPNQSEESLKYLDQILSTFKFTDQIRDTSNWKVYPDNAAAGLPYSFKYPAEVEVAGAQDIIYLKTGNSTLYHRYAGKTTELNSLMNNYQVFGAPAIKFSNRNPVTFGNLSGYEAITPDGLSKYYFLGSNSLKGFLVFNYDMNDTKASDLFSQILSTVKFLN